MTIPDLVLVSGYSKAEQPGIHAFQYDPAQGALTPQGDFSGIANPSFMVVHPNGRWLYAVSETDDGLVYALELQRDPFSLRVINHQPSGGAAPCHLALSADGAWLAVANYTSGTASLLPIADDGTLGIPADLVRHSGSGPHPRRQEGPHAHSATFTPDGGFVIIADLGIDALMVYRLDTPTGRLSLHEQVATEPGAGPRHLAVHPNGQCIYVANELGNTVSVYAYDGTGGLQHRQTLPSLPPDAPENTIADIHLDAAAERLYVSNRGHNSIAVYGVSAHGELRHIATPSCGGNWPRNFAVAPGGAHVLVANQRSDGVMVLPITPDDTALGAPVALATMPAPACVVFVDAL
jgi:6-phosphogluconolactonase